MRELIDMSQAHLTNVKTEIERLEEQQEQISVQIASLKNYLEEGYKVLDTYRAEEQEKASLVKD